MNITDPTAFTNGKPFNAGMAPCIGYFDARKVSSTRTDVLSWDFGDGTDTRVDPVTGKPVNTNNSLTSQVVGHWYANPGTYYAVCKVTSSNGKVAIYPFTVVVQPDTRTQVYFAPNGSDTNKGDSASSPFVSASKFYSVAGQSNIHIRLAAGMHLMIPGCVQLQSNVVIECGGSTITPSKGGLAFAGKIGKTSDVLITHVNFTGSNNTDLPGEQAIRIRGTRVGLVNWTLGIINRGIEVADNPTDCVLIQGLNQLVASGITSQCIYIGGGHRVIELWNTLTGSTAESPDRDTGNTLDGWTIEYCAYSQPHQAKAACTRRAGNDGTVANSLFAGADLSFNVGIGDPDAIETTRITNTVVRECKMNFSGSNGTCRVSPGVIGLTFINNQISRDNGPAFTVSPDISQAPLTDIILDTNVVTGNAVRLLFQPVDASILKSNNNTVNGKAV